MRTPFKNKKLRRFKNENTLQLRLIRKGSQASASEPDRIKR